MYELVRAFHLSENSWWRLHTMFHLEICWANLHFYFEYLTLTSSPRQYQYTNVFPDEKHGGLRKTEVALYSWISQCLLKPTRFDIYLTNRSNSVGDMKIWWDIRKMCFIVDLNRENDENTPLKSRNDENTLVKIKIMRLFALLSTVIHQNENFMRLYCSFNRELSENIKTIIIDRKLTMLFDIIRYGI